MNNAVNKMGDVSKSLPSFLEPIFLLGFVAIVSILLEMIFVEHLIGVLMVAILLYKRNITLRQARLLTFYDLTMPPYVLRDRLPETAPLPPASASEVPLESHHPMPYWEVFRDWDRSRWLNAVIAATWPQVALFTETLVQKIVNDLMKKMKPPGLTVLELRVMKLGTVPLVVEAMKVYPTVKNYLTIDIKFRWVSNAEIICEAGTPVLPSLDVRVEEIQAAGIIRARLSIVPVNPILASMAIQICTPPAVDFNIHITGGKSSGKSGLNVMSVPLVEATVAKVIRMILPSIGLVYPKWMLIPIMDPKAAAPYEKSYNEQPQGILIVKIVDAKNLINVDSLLTGKSDPYVTLSVGDSSKPQKTKVIDNSLNPVWNQKFAIEVSNQAQQKLLLQVFDEDIDDDEAMGELTVNLANMDHGQLRDITAPLLKVNQGTLHFQVLWLECEDDAVRDEIEHSKIQGMQMIENGATVRPGAPSWVFESNHEFGNVAVVSSMYLVEGRRRKTPAAVTAGPSNSGAPQPAAAAPPVPTLSPDVPIVATIYKQAPGIRKVWAKRYLNVSSTTIQIYYSQSDGTPRRALPISKCMVLKNNDEKLGGSTTLYVMTINCSNLGAGGTDPYTVKLGFENQTIYNQVIQRVIQGGGSAR